MFTSQNVSKPKTVFLDVKPTLKTISVRKYSDSYDTGVTTRRDSVVLYGTEARPSLTSAESVEVFEKDVFYYNIFPIIIYLRLIGVLPVTRPGPSKAGFSIMSPNFLYSVIFFIFIVVSIFFFRIRE